MTPEDPTTGSALDTETVRRQFEHLARLYDEQALVALLTQYLAQPLSDSEFTWASMNLANAFACGSRPADAVRMHEEFERWLPGRSPRLSTRFPYYPAPEDSPDPTIGPEEIRVHFLGQSVQFATSYGVAGRYGDFLKKADAALAGVTPTDVNLEVRFYGLLILMT